MGLYDCRGGRSSSSMQTGMTGVAGSEPRMRSSTDPTSCALEPSSAFCACVRPLSVSPCAFGVARTSSRRRVVVYLQHGRSQGRSFDHGALWYTAVCIYIYIYIEGPVLRVLI